MHHVYLAVTLLSILSVPSTLAFQHPSPLDTQLVSMGLDVDSYPPSPRGLSLEQVHIYIRHGEPLPVPLHLYPLAR